MIRTGFFLLIMAAMSACTTDFSGVRVDDFRIDSLRLTGMSKARISASLKIINPTKKLIQLKSAEFDVSTDGGVFAHLRLLEAVPVPAGATDYQPVPLELQITDWLAVIGNIDLRNLEQDLDRFLLSGEMKIKAGAWSRTLKVENRTLKEIINGR
jgi:LEA14-like dessication related protein